MSEQKDPKSKYELLILVAEERRSLDELLGNLNEKQLTAPAFEGGWSIKDIVAHITDWEQRMILWVNESFSGIEPERPAPGMTWDDLDNLNKKTYLANKDKPLMGIMMGSLESYGKAVAIIKKMTDEDLFDGNRFAWRKGDPIWHMVAANTWWHYKEHREQIEAWLSDEEK